MSFPSRSGSGDDHPDHHRTDHVPNASHSKPALFRANPFLDEDEQAIEQLVDQLIALTDDFDEPRDQLPSLQPPIQPGNLGKALPANQPPEQLGKT